ncbi:hypothetical protein OPV22_012105 [Ensete ventricosum]|uniref:Small-subunit processome Utp12 domain-containing protein n=1 Tax=Ensete ventricosum TaxID=4639 RepID=A0AAV8PKG6_ENSVE|nr:hypothetical protein OPV22_012105 [Ensete ventricosum]
MSMSFPNIRDLLASFSPSLDFFAISSGGGRIKIWDTIKGQLQTEFSDIAPSDPSSLLSQPKSGHLSLDYTCMKWVQLEKKIKKKPGNSILVLGTGNGDVLALDVSAGQLRWKVSDCHPGGVTAVSYSMLRRYVYTTGVDGMVCQIDTSTGSILGRFRAFTKPISSMSVSADGKILAAAAGQLKTFNCSDNKKIQKFPGHPVAVRCMIFSEDGHYIVTSGVGERHVAIWKVGSGKKQSSICILSMDHPAIFLDCKKLDNDGKDGAGLSVLAISEMGVCYFWCGGSIEELGNSQPTRISVFLESKKKFDVAIYSAKLLDVPKPASGQVFVAYGSLVKPSFQKLLVQYGVDIKLGDFKGGVLIPIDSFSISQKGQTMDLKETVTALDRANAEDAILPVPKLYAQDKKRKHNVTQLITDIKNVEVDPIINKNKARSAHRKVVLQRMEEDDTVCIEDRLKALGIVTEKVDLRTKDHASNPTNTVLDICSRGIISVDVNMPPKKIRAYISSMSSIDACKSLEILISSLKTSSVSSKHILPWIYYILVNHGQFIISQDSSVQMLDGLHKMIKLKCAAIEPLLKLSGRFRLIMTQMDKAAGKKASMDEHHVEGDKMLDEDEDYVDAEEDDDKDEEIDEMVYGEDESGSDEDDQHQT